LWFQHRGNWTFFGSDGGGKTAAVLRSFIASCKCKRSGSTRLPGSAMCSRIPAHSITRLRIASAQLEANDFVCSSLSCGQY